MKKLLIVTAFLPALALAQGQDAPKKASSTPPKVATPAPETQAPASSAQGSGDLGANDLRVAAQLRAQIEVENLRTQLEAAQHSRILAQQKFSEDLRKGQPNHSSSPSSSSSASTSAPDIFPANAYAVSYYRFGKNNFAKIVYNGGHYLVKRGTVLPDGARVVSVSDIRVLLRHHKASKTLEYGNDSP